MFRKVIYLMLVVILLFSGCSTTTELIDTANQTANSEIQNDEIDEFADEFTENEIEERSDPLKGYNIVMTRLNDSFYESVFNPVSRGYSKILPQEARESVSNFFHNLTYPIRLINNLLQGKFLNATEETGRFVVNTIFGVLGLFDTAGEYFDWQPHNEDFGQTLGYWGVDSGYHIVLPFFGPSNMRDMFSMYPDLVVNPMVYDSNRGYNVVNNDTQSLVLVAYDKINTESLHLEGYSNLKKDVIYLYPFLKNVYEQHREKLIKE